MSGYNPKSCNADSLPYYSPLDVAIRWCNLLSVEQTILTTMGEKKAPTKRDFPQWPCLTNNFNRLNAAMMSGQLPYGRDGVRVEAGVHVAPDRRTINHDDLREWFREFQPGQIEHCPFLFDEVERQAHPAITIDAYKSVCSQRDSYKAKLCDLEFQVQAMQKMISDSTEGQKLKNNKREFMLCLAEMLLGDQVRGWSPNKIASELEKLAVARGKVLPDLRTIREYFKP